MGTRYDLRGLGAEALIQRLRRLLAQDHQVTAELLAHLGEVDARRLYLDHACSSTFGYCVQRLHMSEPTAYKRIDASRTARRFPLVFAMVADGRLHLTGITLLGPRLTEENHRELLAAAAHRSKRDIEQLLAARFPRPDVPPELRKLPERQGTQRTSPVAPLGLAVPLLPVAAAATAPVSTPTSAAPPASTPTFAASAPASTTMACGPATPPPTAGGPATPQPKAGEPAIPQPTAGGPATPQPTGGGPATPPPTAGVPATPKPTAGGPATRQPTVCVPAMPLPTFTLSPPAAPRTEIKPLSSERWALKLTVSRPVRDKLLEAQALLRHRQPDGDMEAVLERALDALLGQLRRDRYGETSSPRTRPALKTERAQSGSRHISNEVKRIVAARDGYQCTFVDADGHRCQERGFLEFDHIVPVAKGGAGDDPGRLRLLCRHHNAHAAERAFGAVWMKRKIAAAVAARGSRHAARPATAPRDDGRLDPEPEPVGLEPGRAGLEPERTRQEPERARLEPERAGLEPGRAGLEPEQAGLEPGRAELGRAAREPGRSGLELGRVRLELGRVRPEPEASPARRAE